MTRVSPFGRMLSDNWLTVFLPVAWQNLMNLQLNDELLSAFLDGEVSAEERQQIESLLAASPEWQKRYRQMVETVNQVRMLPQQPMPRDFSADILAQIAQRQQAEKGMASTSTPPRQPVAVAASSRGSQSERLRKKATPVSPMWMALAACLVVALGLGVAFQAGAFNGQETPVAVDNSPSNPVNAPKNTLANDNRGKPSDGGVTSPETEAEDTTPFPSVEQLANQASPLPIGNQANENSGEKSPIRVRINVRTKPNEEMTTPETRVRPPALARSVFNLDQGDDPGFDQTTLLPLDDDEVVTEFVHWLDSDEDQQLSDSDLQQGWVRFSNPMMQAPPISESTLKAIDQDKNSKISSAEFHLMIASVRWKTSEQVRRAWFRLDANGDGLWSADDFNDNVRFAQPQATLQREVSQWHSVLDRSHSQTVSRVEFAMSAGRMQLSMKKWERTILNPRVFEQTQQLLTEFDRDSNGVLAGRELRRLVEGQPEVKKLLEDVDQDRVSAYDLYAMIESSQM